MDAILHQVTSSMHELPHTPENSSGLKLSEKTTLKNKKKIQIRIGVETIPNNNNLCHNQLKKTWRKSGLKHP